MKKILGLFLGAYVLLSGMAVYAAEKFDILPDLPEPLAAAQASSVTTVDNSPILTNSVQSVGHEPNFFTVTFSLIFVILIIYATAIIYAKLNGAGLKTLKKQIGAGDCSKAAVISTTPLGANKTLHVVELDGKRMLIGASANGIHLIKDLGSFPPQEFEEGEYSKIEIPNIRIPKIEIPKIEFPNIGFTKAFSTKNTKNTDTDVEQSENVKSDNSVIVDDDGFTISDIYEEGADGIIDKLFSTQNGKEQNSSNSSENNENNATTNKHKVDPDEYILYKKYL